MSGACRGWCEWQDAIGVPNNRNNYVVCNTHSGVLSYDSNGDVAGGVTQIAVLTGHPIITAADFVVI